MKNYELWKRISAIEIDNPAASFDFTTRLARENGWNKDFARSVVEEYRRFAYLAMVAGHEVTPSDEVDQAWHLHLAYTRHYWGEWQEALGSPLHHGPTTGGKREDDRYLANYENTLASYELEFGHPAPEDVWPDSAARFSDAAFFRRVNINSQILIPVRTAKGLAAVAAASLLAAVSLLPFASSAQNSDGGTVGNQATFGLAGWVLVALGVLVFIVILWLAKGKSRGKQKGRNADQSGSGGFFGGCSCNSGCNSGCSSGCGGGGCGN